MKTTNIIYLIYILFAFLSIEVFAKEPSMLTNIAQTNETSADMVATDEYKQKSAITPSTELTLDTPKAASRTQSTLCKTHNGGSCQVGLSTCNTSCSCKGFGGVIISGKISC